MMILNLDRKISTPLSQKKGLQERGAASSILCVIKKIYFNELLSLI